MTDIRRRARVVSSLVLHVRTVARAKIDLALPGLRPVGRVQLQPREGWLRGGQRGPTTAVVPTASLFQVCPTPSIFRVTVA